MEFLLALIFYIIFVLFAAIGLPITRRLIFNDILAYVAAKPAGLILFGYFIWLLGSFKILSYQNYPVIMVFFVAAVGLGIYSSRDFFIPRKVGPVNKKILALEGLAVLAYLLYLYLRSYNSAINGTERFMDMALLSSAGKTDFFPFIDPWFAGKTINYYYYGSYLMSLISNIGKLPYVFSYTFALGLLYSQSLLLAGVLTWAMTKSKKAAALVAFLVTTAGTLFFAGCTAIGAFGAVKKVCSYASSTRLYKPSYIINEIPSYSFTVGDLHAHLLALPFFLFNLILFYALAALQKPDWRLLGLISLGIATSGMINAWDAITLIAILGVIGLIKFFQARREDGGTRAGKRSAWDWLAGTGAVIGLTVLLMMPYLINFQSPVMGIGFAPSFVALHNLKDIQYPTPLLAMAGMWGVFTIGIFYMIFFRCKQLSEHSFLVALVVVASGILVGVELFFIRDIYSVTNPPYFRANTTFKFGFHAWVMFSIVFGVFMTMLYRDKTSRKHAFGRTVAFLLVAVSIVGGLVYPREAVEQFYSSGTNFNNKTLDGSVWMKNMGLGDWETVKYINNNVHSRSVIAEAVGDSYTTFSRITTFTGMITPMGWKTHEWTWRFQKKNAKQAVQGETIETGWGAVAKVEGDMQTLYTTEKLAETRNLIKQYGIQYVYVGEVEKSFYGNLQEDKFYSLGSVVFEYGNNKLFKVK